MMDQHSAVHATFTLERTYGASPRDVFAAWADPVAKARWFSGPESDYQLDFRVGGREVTTGNNNGTRMTFESFYRDIVPDERIVYTSTLSADEVLSTVSLTTVELTPSGDGTRLVLTEQGAFLDGLEQPSWREQGTGDWLDALGTDLKDRSRT
jgi:uncharacterized protein YndB with AHSA1/START domain